MTSQPRLADIGEPQREVTFEPLPTERPETSPTQPQPDFEPVPA